jgi:hypothetical protein
LLESKISFLLDVAELQLLENLFIKINKLNRMSWTMKSQVGSRNTLREKDQTRDKRKTISPLFLQSFCLKHNIFGGTYLLFYQESKT